jgi:hypothetical protein
VSTTIERYADDPDARIDWPITHRTGGTVDWPSPQVIATSRGVATTIACAWQGDPATERDLRIPLDSLAVGSYTLRLLVPGDNDIPLVGTVRLR